MATLEELQKRIQRLEDVKQIERLQKIYGYYRDYVEWEKIVDLFSDNAKSVEDGWLNLPVMNLIPIPDADGPPTAFHPYPDYMYNVPYHYKHPITGE